MKQTNPNPGPTDAPAAVKRLSECPDCHTPLEQVKLIDATEPSWDNTGARHIELSYAAPEARQSFFLGKIQRLGVIVGLICPNCGRILLYGARPSM